MPARPPASSADDPPSGSPAVSAARDRRPSEHGGRVVGYAGRIRAAVDLIRPHQWTKNGLCMAGVIFSGNLLNPAAVVLGLLTVLVFSLGSSSVYVLNDIVDRQRDRRHPRKRRRPLASGRIGVASAAGIGVLLAGCALGGAWLLHPAAFACLVVYGINGVVYSLYSKHVALVDVMAIAFGFVLRLLAGVYVLGILPTAWITLCTFFLALFLGLAKRRAELGNLGEAPGDDGERRAHRRPVLFRYSIPYLDSLLNGAATVAVMSYALFTAATDKNHSLVITLPIVYYAIMHYKRRVMIQDAGEEPDRLLFTDPRIPLCAAAWLVLYLLIEYSGVRLFV